MSALTKAQTLSIQKSSSRHLTIKKAGLVEVKLVKQAVIQLQLCGRDGGHGGRRPGGGVSGQ